MLIFKRRVSEAVIVGEGANAVEVVLYAIDGGSVRLGFKAPPQVKIDRKEIRELILSNGGRRDDGKQPQADPEDDIGPTV